MKKEKSGGAQAWLLLLYEICNSFTMNVQQPGQPGLTFNESMKHPEDDKALANAPPVRWWEWPARLFFGPNFRG